MEFTNRVSDTLNFVNESEGDNTVDPSTVDKIMASL